ncbi:hypothetical protein OUZ56_016800 [Daphnia magna]|uniref:Chromo domain-containing protein n=1 Tax=Daphnia magna TaxID=35525 RepID=A0ABR0ARL5_9CRUS|nr:hypothetical protein OUZ56_016800 [Daphnia magna]
MAGLTCSIASKYSSLVEIHREECRVDIDKWLMYPRGRRGLEAAEIINAKSFTHYFIFCLCQCFKKDSIRSTSGSSRIPSRIQFCWKQMVDTDWEPPEVVRKKYPPQVFESARILVSLRVNTSLICKMYSLKEIRTVKAFTEAVHDFP